MFVHQIKEFISLSRACAEIKSLDFVLLNELETLISAPDLSSKIDVNLFESICLVFAKRWALIFDTPDDYMRNHREGINERWIALATELSIESNRTSLQILVPVAQNTIDLTSFKRVTEAITIEKWFLSDDQKNIFSLEGLLDRLERKLPLAIYQNNKRRVRALSLQELLRIKLNMGNGRVYDFAQTSQESSFWYYLKHQVMPSWKAKGETPKQLLPTLLDLVDAYFNSEDIHVFRNKVLVWSKSLISDHSVADVNCLYGQTILADGHSHYLLDILIACLANDQTNLDNKMLGLARWICSVDPSFVSEHDRLRDVYVASQVGPSGFSVKSLKALIFALGDDGDRYLRSIIHRIAFLFEQRNLIDGDVLCEGDVILKELEALYTARWARVQGTVRDYTRLQTDVNAAWILLAQQLSSAKLISKDYYCYLMPSLTHETDLTSRAPLSHFPLSHYVLSESGRELILLDMCLLHYKHHRTFYNCTASAPLTDIEIDRMSFSHERFKRYIKQARVVYQDYPLRLSTLMAVKELVDRSLYANGLTDLTAHNNDEVISVDQAYLAFYKFLATLPKEERQKLLSQHILLRDRWQTVKEVLDEVNQGALQLQEEEKGFKSTESTGCITWAAKYFAQLVMDYCPDLKFRPDLEKHVRFVSVFEKMRASSQGKVLREEHDKAMVKIQSLMFSMLTHDFSKSKQPCSTITLDGMSNQVPDPVRNIFLKLSPLLEGDQYINAKSIHNQIIDTMVKPILAEYNGVWSYFFWPDPVISQWLKSTVLDADSLGSERFNNSMYEQIWILDTLLPIEYIPLQDKRLIDLFLSDVLSSYLGPHNPVLCNVKTNIQFSELLKVMNPYTRKKILISLEKLKKNSFDNAAFKEKWADTLELRLHSLQKRGKSASDSGRPSFFDTKSTSKAVNKSLSSMITFKQLVEILSKLPFVSMTACVIAQNTYCSSRLIDPLYLF